VTKPTIAERVALLHRPVVEPQFNWEWAFWIDAEGAFAGDITPEEGAELDKIIYPQYRFHHNQQEIHNVQESS